jgi:hypothetical protein
MKTRLRDVLALLFLVVPALGFAQVSATVQVETPEVRVDATTAPPGPRAEVQPPAPAPGYAWVPGHWRWERGAYVWRAGHWTRPPSSGAVWVPAQWVKHGGAWYFKDGHWKAATVPPPYVAPAPRPPAYYNPPATAEVTVGQAPPAPQVEAQTAPPYSGAVWIGGYWAWNGRQYIWVPGSWSAPRPGFVWVPGHWKATPGGWKWAAGHWRHV